MKKVTITVREPHADAHFTPTLVAAAGLRASGDERISKDKDGFVLSNLDLERNFVLPPVSPLVLRKNHNSTIWECEVGVRAKDHFELVFKLDNILFCLSVRGTHRERTHVLKADPLNVEITLRGGISYSGSIYRSRPDSRKAYTILTGANREYTLVTRDPVMALLLRAGHNASGLINTIRLDREHGPSNDAGVLELNSDPFVDVDGIGRVELPEKDGGRDIFFTSDPSGLYLMGVIKEGRRFLSMMDAISFYEGQDFTREQAVQMAALLDAQAKKLTELRGAYELLANGLRLVHGIEKDEVGAIQPSECEGHFEMPPLCANDVRQFLDLPKGILEQAPTTYAHVNKIADAPLEYTYELGTKQQAAQYAMHAMQKAEVNRRLIAEEEAKGLGDKLNTAILTDAVKRVIRKKKEEKESDKDA